MAAPFDYEGVNDAALDQHEANLNRHDPTGEAARLIMPAKRQRQLMYRPNAKSPHFSVTIRAPSTLSLSKPFPVTSTLTHHPSPSGNPDNKPVTLDLGFTCLDEIVDHAIYPWLIMHRTPSGGLKELDDDNDGTCPPGDIPNDGVNDRVPIALDHGFVSLAVGESVDVKAELRYTGYGVLLEEGEEYCLNFRGTRLKWWTFGSLEDLKQESRPSLAELARPKLPFITLAASNLIDFTVVG
ncbi:MAG: hypothetical protein Q9172_004283 [Xanthocarpia lactea]